MSVQFLECRDLRHAWEHYGDTVVVSRRREVRVFVRVLRCARCEAQRQDTYSIGRRTVDRVGTKYRYPTGYLTKGGLRAADARFLLFKDVEMTTAKEMK